MTASYMYTGCRKCVQTLFYTLRAYRQTFRISRLVYYGFKYLFVPRVVLIIGKGRSKEDSVKRFYRKPMISGDCSKNISMWPQKKYL